MVDKNKFWKTIQVAIDSQSTSKKDYLATLENEVAQLPLADIVRWQSYFNTYLELASKEKVWAAAFILNKGDCDDEQFDAFCAWLISMGKTYYLAVIANLDLLAKLNVSEPASYRASFEELLYSASEIYIRKALLQPLMNVSKAEGQFLRAVETHQLAEDELFELRREINYENDINRVWHEGTIERIKESLPNLSATYLPFLDKNAVKYQPNTEVYLDK